MPRILLIDDEQSLASTLKRVLEIHIEDCQVTVDSDAVSGLKSAATGDYQVVVTDLMMPGLSGMEVVKSLQQAKPHLPVILMTGHHTTDVAIEAMKHGAFDYITKPPDEAEFIGLVSKAADLSSRMSERVAIGDGAHGKDAIIGQSQPMQEVFKQIGRVAGMPVTVLIRGETGTGKELVARAIYQHSNRDKQPFIEINCAAIPDNLLESELFGHEPGAFTDAKTRRIGRFEQADKGTIFLDEIGDMSPGTQVKLLRVLQDRRFQRLAGKEIIEVDVRVIAATHRDLEAAIQEMEFREDLYHRLTDSVIQLPPLRDRVDDIPALVAYFIQRYGADLGASAAGMPDAEGLSFLKEQRWPGNVRELSNVIRKALVLGRGYPITRELLSKVLAQTQLARPAKSQDIAGYVGDLLAKARGGDITNVHEILTEALERELYTQAIKMAHGDQSKAAGWLGVSRPTIREKLLRFGVHPSQAE